MKRTPKKPLQLTVETVRTLQPLDAAALKQVAGGFPCVKGPSGVINCVR